MGSAIITFYREDNSVIGEPEVRENVEPGDFDSLAQELDDIVAEQDDVARYQLLGA